MASSKKNSKNKTRQYRLSDFLIDGSAIEICSQKWTVLREKLEDDFGVYDPVKNTITIQHGLSSDRAEEVLLHEILHVIFDISGLSRVLKPVDEERVASSVSPFLFSFLKGNGLVK